MIPFKLPKWRQKLIDRKYQRKDHVINTTVKKMESVMKDAVDQVLYNYSKMGRYVEPTLQSMFEVSASFYRDVVHQAFYASQDEKAGEKKDLKLKHLSQWPIGIPRKLPELEKIFRDKRYWPMIMKRSNKMTERLRQMYLKKLNKRFSHILPDLDKGLVTPAEAREQLMDAWDASKSRVELIFRTETTTYFAKTQVAFFSSDSEIIGFLFDSVRDTSRSKWCHDRHGLIYRPNTPELTANSPSLHWNCRSSLIPLANIEYNRKMLEDPRRDPKNRKVAPLPPGWRK